MIAENAVVAVAWFVAAVQQVESRKGCFRLPQRNLIARHLVCIGGIVAADFVVIVVVAHVAAAVVDVERRSPPRLVLGMMASEVEVTEQVLGSTMGFEE